MRALERATSLASLARTGVLGVLDRFERREATQRRRQALFALVFALALVVAQASAQTPPPPPPPSPIEDTPRVTSKSASAGFVEFHVVPEIGVGIFLEDSQVVTFGGNDVYAMFRLPGLFFPKMNETTTGFMVEFSQTPVGTFGVRYDILSYTRTKIAGPAYTGVNIRIATGASEVGAELSGRVMPVVGIRLMTIAEHVPVLFEVEFLDDNRPLKVMLVLTWE